MNQIRTRVLLRGIDETELRRFIEHWRKINDFPCNELHVQNRGKNSVELDIFYPLDIFDKSVTQFLSILFGEALFIKQFGKQEFLNLELPKKAYSWFKGPAFGALEVKKRFRATGEPLLMAIIKPSIGKETTTNKIESKIKAVLENGFHAIKDDEMQGNLPYAPLGERLRLAKKYERYVPALNLDSPDEYLKILGTKKSKKIGMVLVNASTIGFPALHEIRKKTKVPILSHVAMQGVYQSCFSPALFASLHRLFGADAFTNPIGDMAYFKVTRPEEHAMANSFTTPLPIRPTLPLLTGGARIHNLERIVSHYEEDGIPYGIVFGTQVFSAKMSPAKACQEIVNELDRIQKIRRPMV